jgi:hypothetical protein
VERIESAHSTWLFDPDRRRFRRLPPDVDPDAPALESDWEPYWSLEVDDATGAFTVTLNEDGTRLLRAFRTPTSDDATQELSVQPKPGTES